MAEQLRSSMETAFDCVRLVIADGARFQKAVAKGVAEGTISTSDDHFDGPVIGDIEPQRPVDELRAAMASPDPVVFRQAIVLAAAAMGWAAEQTGQTVAQVLSELNALILSTPPPKV
jgi:hypothetical protein